MEKIQQEHENQLNDTGFVSLLRSFSEHPFPRSSPSFPNDDRFECVDKFGEQSNSESSKDDSDSFSDVGEYSNDDESENPTQPYSEGVMKFFNDIKDDIDGDIPDVDDNIRIDLWSESEREIRLGMRFESKAQLKKAIALWSLANNGEFKVVESKGNTWVAKCKTYKVEEAEASNNAHYEPQCDWYVRALKKKTHKMWEITRWVNTHNFMGAYSSNYKTNLTSAIIASHILHSLESDPSYSVKSIQADIKNYLNADVSYKKAWYGKKKAMKILYGDWESNFAELPSYIAALEASNPNTIVKWLHHQNNSSNIMTFKYVFWAFGPSVDAFHQCRPVICVDGTHLRGGYKGKMLIAVTKDANNHILPVAYAIVDEETNQSWCWFLEQFRYYVAQDRRLCVVSDRHRGIINAMMNIEEWKEPMGYHRFCLRHLRSNFNYMFKNIALKRLCWAMGSTCQVRKFIKYINDMKKIDPNAWLYLKQIDKSKWCIAFDDCLRWDFQTTNASESFNNVLRGARLLPIKALINLTFNRTVSMFQKYSSVAQNSKAPLPPTPWRIFKKNDIHAQSHRVQEFDNSKGVYRVVTKQQINGSGGNVHTVKYLERTCTCGKWQAYRFPCSHALAVCRQKRDNPLHIIDNVYSTSTFRQQYSATFNPLPHFDYWINPQWSIQADPTKLVVRRGRRQQSRFRNEMDTRDPKEPRKCGKCKVAGHNQRKCPSLFF